MATSPRLAHAADDRAAATTAFLEAFTSATIAVDRDLEALFISAVVACAGPSQVIAFLKRVHSVLDGTGPLDDAELVRWRWMIVKFRLMEEHDAKRFNDDVVAAVTMLEKRIESRNDPDVQLEMEIQVEDKTDAPAREDTVTDESTTAWEAIANAFRDSSRQTLRRLVSGSSTQRDSVSSADGVESVMSSRRSRQRQSQAVTDANGVPVLQRSSSMGSDALPSFLHSFSSMVGMSMEETFLCQICFEHVPVVDGVELTVCRHRFCFSCIKTYVELKIADGQVYTLCFHETESTTISTDGTPPQRKACGTPIAPCDIETLVFPDVWKKYLTFKFNKENEYGRQCPYCDESQVCAGPERPDCVCQNPACGKPFCFTHGNAHADGTCADFELKQVEQEKLNRSAIAAIAKPCPGCKSNVEKSGGCNHMKCVVCSTDFCWICGAVVDSNLAPTHFQWWNLSGCAGQQMEDVDAQTPSERFWMGVLRIAMVVFLGPPAFVITLALTLVSCCCLPCVAGLQLTFRECFTACLNGVVLGLLLVITGICMAVVFIGGVVYDLIAYPYRRIRAWVEAKKPTPTENSLEQTQRDDVSSISPA